MDKGWWYVIALVVVILALTFVFKDEVGLSPRGGDIVEEESSDVNLFGDGFGSNDKGTEEIREMLIEVVSGERG